MLRAGWSWLQAAAAAGWGWHKVMFAGGWKLAALPELKTPQQVGGLYQYDCTAYAARLVLSVDVQGCLGA